VTVATSYYLDAGLVAVSGPDATSFLQSLLSQDLDPIAVGESAPALLLQPQGKLIATMRALHAADDTWWCVTDEGAGAALAEGLNRFRIRVKAEVTDASADFAVVAVRGPDASEVATAAVADEGAFVLPAEWGDEVAVDIVGPRAAIEDIHARLRATGVADADRDAYEVARVTAGVPRLGVDIDERTIPQEAFLEQHAVSFTKGCFVGQELVCRIDTRGHVNRFLRRVTFTDATPPAGAEIVVGDKVVGALTSVAGNAALAMVRREIEPPTDVTVRWAGAEAQGRVEAL
jgi:folate-binding protein YgfZ